MQYPSWKEKGKIKLMIIVGTRPEIIRLYDVNYIILNPDRLFKTVGNG